MYKLKKKKKIAFQMLNSIKKSVKNRNQTNSFFLTFWLAVEGGFFKWKKKNYIRPLRKVIRRKKRSNEKKAFWKLSEQTVVRTPEWNENVIPTSMSAKKIKSFSNIFLWFSYFFEIVFFLFFLSLQLFARNGRSLRSH